MYTHNNKYKHANRDRENCKKCNFYNYLCCPYVKLDGTCSVNGYKVAEDYTYGRNLKK